MTDERPEIEFPGLDALREELDAVDAELVAAMGRRLTLVEQIGAIKKGHGHQTRDFRREKIVLEKAAEAARRAGVDPALATDVLKRLIRSSLQEQERFRLRDGAQGAGKRALIVGGAGRMGRWFDAFFHSQGFAVDIVDPAADAALPNVYPSLDASGTDHDVIVLATTLQLTARLLEQLRDRAPAGLVFDIGSLKSPLAPPLRALADSGVRATSLHPMFGPSTRLLAGRHIIFCDAGHAEATQSARALFAQTMASCVDMSLEAHDQLIAYVLGLSHLVNIAFADCLARSGIDAGVLGSISSPTYDAQREMGETVVSENPDLYFEIQRLNDFGAAALDGLEASVMRLRDAVRADDAATFREAMLAARDYLADSAERT